VVTGRNPNRARALLDGLKQAGLAVETVSIPGEPTTRDAEEGVRIARRARCDVVVAIGGGSVLDAGKVTAALLANPGELMEHLEVIGEGRPLTVPSAPMIAIPTTAGTGSEVTRNGVLGSPEHRVKVSLRSPLMLPRLALVDPELTHSMPADVTASTGLDAFTQLLEAFVSVKANALTDGICREGLARVVRSLRRACEDGNDAGAREDMSLASLFGGLALANAGLGAVHGFAGPLGGMFTAAHGAVCARLLPYVVKTNVQALREREPESSILGRFDEVARIVTGTSGSRAEDAVDWIRSLCTDLSIPSLSAFGMKETDIPAVVEKSRAASSMKGNPIRFTDGELASILEAAL
jgi:alcohol dehydrogenase class IV